MVGIVFSSTCKVFYLWGDHGSFWIWFMLFVLKIMSSSWMKIQNSDTLNKNSTTTLLFLGMTVMLNPQGIPSIVMQSQFSDIEQSIWQCKLMNIIKVKTVTEVSSKFKTFKKLFKIFKKAFLKAVHSNSNAIMISCFTNKLTKLQHAVTYIMAFLKSNFIMRVPAN